MSEATLLWATTGIPTHDEQAKLRLEPREHVLRVARLRRYDGRPVAYEMATLPLAMVPKWHGVPLCEVHELAAAHGVTLGCAHETAAGTTADTAVAGQLGIPVGSAVTVLERLVLTDSGVPVEWRVAFVAA